MPRFYLLLLLLLAGAADGCGSLATPSGDTANSPGNPSLASGFSNRTPGFSAWGGDSQSETMRSFSDPAGMVVTGVLLPDGSMTGDTLFEVSVLLGNSQ